MQDVYCSLSWWATGAFLEKSRQGELNAEDERLNAGICPALNFDLVYIVGAKLSSVNLLDLGYIAAEPFIPWRSRRTRKTGRRFSAHFYTRTQRSYQRNVSITLRSRAVFVIKRTIVFIIKTDTHDDKADLKFTNLFSFSSGEERTFHNASPLEVERLYIHTNIERSKLTASLSVTKSARIGSRFSLEISARIIICAHAYSSPNPTTPLSTVTRALSHLSPSLST